MTKNSLSILLNILTVCMCFCVNPAFAYLNEPDGFGDVKWQTPLELMEPMKLKENYGAYKEYIKIEDKTKLFGLKPTSILYGYTSGIYPILQDRLITEHGTGDRIGENDMIWRGNNTNIKLERYGDGEEN